MRILRLVIECETPLHCGGGEDYLQDQPVTRDAFGYWRIPGTSLAGSLRSLGEKIDAALTPQMFGDQQKDRSAASLIWCEDGLLLDYNGKPAMERLLCGDNPKITCGPFVRDHVRIAPQTGAAQEGGKFDTEIVPAGARFLLEFRCDGWDCALRPDELAYFDQLAAQVLAGNLALGGKTALGYGQYKVLAYEYRDLDLFTPEGMQDWLDLPAFGLSAVGKEVTPGSCTQPQTSGLDGWIEFTLECADPVLIGGGVASRTSGGEADILFALTPYIQYDKSPHQLQAAALPASSLRGILRHAAYRILADLGCATGEKIIDDLFGFVNGSVGKCGKIIITDAPLQSKGNHFQFEQHVAIDRFTGGAVEGALFSEEPYWNKDTQANVRIRTCNLEAHEAALFFHILFDLFEGSLAIGSGVNRGNGRLTLAGWKTSPQKAASLLKGDLSWEGQPLLNGSLVTLEQLAPQWDRALKAVL